jgi:hypothetical protein
MKYLWCLVLCCMPAVAQIGFSERITQDLSNFQSADWTQRAAAFYDLTTVGCPKCQGSQFPVIDGIQNAMRSGAVSPEALTKALITLLTREAEYNRSAVPSNESLTEEHADYNGDLVMVMGILRDKRSVLPLFEFVDSGNMAQDTLAGLGDESLIQAEAVLSAEPFGSLRRSSTLRVIHKMASQKNLQRFTNPASSRNAIKTALINGLSEHDYSGRIEAIQGLAQLGDKDVIPLIASLAATDEYFDKGPDQAIRYAVRLEADKALRTLEAN